MVATILPKPFHKLLIIGSINGKLDKLSKIEEIASQYDWLIFNGGLYGSSDNLDQIKRNIQKFNQWSKDKSVIYINGRQDFLLAKQTDDSEIIQWVNSHCNIVLADFASRTVIITGGGIPATVKARHDLLDNLEVSFVSYIDGRPWHQCYNGGLGYVISNNPPSDTSPQYYNYSMQLGNFSSVYAQEVNEVGLKPTILL